MSTIQQVAKAAGVSVATVSRVLNHSDKVVDETRARVERAIQELNYSPNMMGRNLRRNATEIIMVLLPSISNPFYAHAVNGITAVANNNGFTVTVCNTLSDRKLERDFLNLLKFKLVDGAVLMSQEMDDSELEELGRLYPVVQCSEYIDAAGVPYVTIDNASAAYDAVSHLASLGHTRIGLISSKVNYYSAAHRQSGYLQALQDAGLEFESELIKFGDYGYGSGMKCAEQFMRMQNRPTAVFAISDPMAIGALKAFRQKGLKIPEDIAVVGFDNIRFSKMCEPELTTIAQPTYKMGCRAMELLLERVEHKQDLPEKVIMDYELIIRGSTVAGS